MYEFLGWFNETGFLSPPKVPEETIQTSLQQAQQKKLLPIKITIPNLALNLPIAPSRILNGNWETSEKGASYGLGSGLPGEVGNTVIFGHNRFGLFAPLYRVKENDEVVVETEDGTYTYVVVAKQIINPDNIAVIKPTDDETLTLYTCSGLNDEKRLVVQAKRKQTS